MHGSILALFGQIQHFVNVLVEFVHLMISKSCSAFFVEMVKELKLFTIGHGVSERMSIPKPGGKNSFLLCFSSKLTSMTSLPNNKPSV